jgi:hypothetical protein
MYSSITSSLEASLGAFSKSVSDSCDILDGKISEVSQRVDEVTNKTTDLETNKSSGFIGGGRQEVTFAKLAEYHNGIENGLVGEKDSNKTLKALALRDLRPDEVPALLKVDEAVLTDFQQKLVTNNFATAYKSGMNSAVNNIVTKNTAPTNVTTFGDIHVHEIQKASDFAKALQTHLPNISVQYNGKH